jgi:hypothetical protein
VVALREAQERADAAVSAAKSQAESATAEASVLRAKAERLQVSIGNSWCVADCHTDLGSIHDLCLCERRNGCR